MCSKNAAPPIPAVRLLRPRVEFIKSPSNFDCPKNQNIMKFLRKLTNCAVWADFRDATFAQTGPNSRFLRDFFAQNGAFVQYFVRDIYFLGSLTGNFGAGKRISEPRNFFFGARNFFSGLGRKNPGAETFSRRLRGRFSFPLELFPGHVSRVILSAESPGGLSRRSGFCAGSVPCPVKRTGLEGIPRHFDFCKARVAAFFPRCPVPAAEYANLRRRK